MVDMFKSACEITCVWQCDCWVNKVSVQSKRFWYRPYHCSKSSETLQRPLESRCWCVFISLYVSWNFTWSNICRVNFIWIVSEFTLPEFTLVSYRPSDGSCLVQQRLRRRPQPPPSTRLFSSKFWPNVQPPKPAQPPWPYHTPSLKHQSSCQLGLKWEPICTTYHNVAIET